MKSSERKLSRKRSSRLPAQNKDAGKDLVEVAYRELHPDFQCPSKEEEVIFRRAPGPVPDPYSWTMEHPEFREAQDSECNAEVLLLAMSKMGRELVLAEAGKLPGGWTAEEVMLFWRCELRYSYTEERRNLQASLPPEKIEAFRKELAHRRNNARKRNGNPPPVRSDPNLGTLVQVDPIRADLPVVPLLLITFWTWRPLWLADSESIAGFVDRMIERLRLNEKPGTHGQRLLTRKHLPTPVNARHIDKVISRYRLHRHQGPGRMKFDGRTFAPDAGLEPTMARCLERQRRRVAMDEEEFTADGNDSVLRILDEELAYIRFLEQGG